MRGLPDSWRHRRVGELPALDVFLAAALAAVALATVLAGPREGPLPVTLPVAGAMTAALAWRSRAPLGMALVVGVAAWVQSLEGHSPGALWALVVFLVATYSVALQPVEERAALGGVILVGSLFLQEWSDDGSDYLFIVLIFGGAWLLGRALLSWRSRAVSAVAEADDRARLAVAEERLRLARELHDVVAHGLGVIAVQAEAARAALDHDPELARSPLAAVLSQSRGAIGEMRRLLGVLRDDGDGVPRNPQPGVADLEGLVAGFRHAGLPVELRVSCGPDPLPPTVDLAAYRIVQEGLTNVLKHAGTPVTTVVVGREGGTVSIDVSNAAGSTGTARGGGTGHGLIGVRERVLAAGGELRHGARSTGGFRLNATLPVREQGL